MRVLFLVVISIFFSSTLFSQKVNYRTELDSLLIEGIKLINESKLDDAILLFNKALDIDNTKWQIHYEKALAYYQKKEFDSVITILGPFFYEEDLNDNYYQILGSSLDIRKMYDSAQVVYEKGLEKFPNSGKLFMEFGIHNIEIEEPIQGLALWERGVEVDPGYENNYYMLSKYYYHSNEFFWSLMYGEIFLNMSEKGGRLADLSNFIYSSYASALFKQVDSSKTDILFTKLSIRGKNIKDREDLPLEFAYQMVMQEAAKDMLPSSKKALTIDVLYKLRTKFIEIWYKDKWNERYSNAIFDLHKKLIESKNFEAYNYWVFNTPRKTEADAWLKINRKKLEDLGLFMVKQKFRMNKGNYINRAKYTRSY